MTSGNDMFRLSPSLELPVSRCGANALAESLYVETKRTEDSLTDIAGAAFRFGDELQRGLAGLLYRAGSAGTDANYWAKLVRHLTWQIEEFAKAFENEEERDLVIQQARNTLQVFNLVRNVRGALGVRPDQQVSLIDLVKRAYALGDYPDIWAVEGIGHDFAQSVWSGSLSQEGLMKEGAADALPVESLAMMHAGMGICFAERLMKTVTPYSDPPKVRRTVESFIGLCRNNSRPGYAGCAIESLGLVTRTWHPRMVGVLDCQLLTMAPCVREYFWHGVGRALYFSPSHLLPPLFSPWAAVDCEARDTAAKQNARSGLSWATMLVNLRHPRIMLSLLDKQSAEIDRDDAFANGVASSVAVAADTTPGDPVIRRFLAYRPTCHQAIAKIWEAKIRQPAAVAVERYQPVLRATGHLEDVFRYQPLPALMDALESGGGSRTN